VKIQCHNIKVSGRWLLSAQVSQTPMLWTQTN